MFFLSFVLEDWAIYELVPDKKARAAALLWTASSYVTWTYQAHTFSNSIETVIVLWCMVLVNKLMADDEHTRAKTCACLGFLGILGTFNRITFPAWLVVGGVQLLPRLYRKPRRLGVLAISAALTTVVAVATDTEYYTGERLHLRALPSAAVFTPLNNLRYNLDPSNLAQHGLHPFYQHFLANLPQLLGPAFILVFTSNKFNVFWLSGICGTILLSLFKHQEARFLLPAIPLLLSSIQLPSKGKPIWLGIWITFNVLAALVFGIFHQGGVLPTQSWIEKQHNIDQVLWWKTYSPPRWILGRANERANTTDLMGIPETQLMERLSVVVPSCEDGQGRTLLIAPWSQMGLDRYDESAGHGVWRWERAHFYRPHAGLDDLDFGEEGVVPTLRRVVGRRGLVVWEVRRNC